MIRIVLQQLQRPEYRRCARSRSTAARTIPTRRPAGSRRDGSWQDRRACVRTSTNWLLFPLARPLAARMISAHVIDSKSRSLGRISAHHTLAAVVRQPHAPPMSTIPKAQTIVSQSCRAGSSREAVRGCLTRAGRACACGCFAGLRATADATGYRSTRLVTSSRPPDMSSDTRNPTRTWTSSSKRTSWPSLTGQGCGRRRTGQSCVVRSLNRSTRRHAGVASSVTTGLAC